MKLTVIVVLYNKIFIESNTLLSLRDCNLDNVRVVVFNNGPYQLDENEFSELSFNKCNNHEIQIMQDITNLPLSIIYNRIIAENSDSNFIMLLDDDTIIPKDYFDFLNNQNDFDIAIPLISSTDTNEYYYPKIDGSIITESGYISISNELQAIASGLIISKTLTGKVLEFYPDIFDSRFALYGVDFNFFKRLMQIQSSGVKIKFYITKPLKHSLSRLEVPNSSWRYLERLYDVILSQKYYEKNKLKKIKCTSRLLFVNLIKFHFKNAYAIFYALIVGMHPRSYLYFKKNKTVLDDKGK
ncbi:glycosyltransferase family protein [Enterobacter adelaidei]